jgi:hypothetical protein
MHPGRKIQAGWLWKRLRDWPHFWVKDWHGSIGSDRETCLRCHPTHYRGGSV